jgi:hypothetical protein
MSAFKCASNSQRWRLAAAATCLAGALAGCQSTGGEQAAAPSGAAAGAIAARPSAIRREQLVGKWGVGSFRQEKDRPRVTAIARGACKQPYVIAAGPNEGVMMHAADDAQLYELKLKGGSDGKTYLGFEAPPGHLQDRIVVSVTEREMVLQFVDPDAANRYGTMLYVRCA